MSGVRSSSWGDRSLKKEKVPSRCKRSRGSRHIWQSFKGTSTTSIRRSSWPSTVRPRKQPTECLSSRKRKTTKKESATWSSGRGTSWARWTRSRLRSTGSSKPGRRRTRNPSLSNSTRAPKSRRGSPNYKSSRSRKSMQYEYIPTLTKHNHQFNIFTNN